MKFVCLFNVGIYFAVSLVFSFGNDRMKQSVVIYLGLAALWILMYIASCLYKEDDGENS